MRLARFVTAAILLATTSLLWGGTSEAQIENFPTGQTIRLANDNSGMCLDVPGNNAFVGQGLIQWPCHGQPSQQFVQERGGNLQHKASGFCVDAAALNGAALHLDHCRANNEWWLIEWADNGGWEFNLGVLINGRADFCMDVPWSSTRAGQGLIVWTCTANPNQRWRPTVIVEVRP